MINIVLPIAGRGSRFVEAGFVLPKPLIPVQGKPMIEIVVNNIKPKEPHRFIFVALKEHLSNLELQSVLQRIAPGCIIVPVDEVTEGAACTVLLAKEYINNDYQLMIANSDQYVDININDYLSSMKNSSADGMIMTMFADDPKWSYVGLRNDKTVRIVVEKEVISNEATVGIYNFKCGSDFVKAAEKMIIKNLRVNNEFYVAPAYNELINEKFKIITYNVGKEYDGMYGLGIPSDLKLFSELDISIKASS